VGEKRQNIFDIKTKRFLKENLTAEHSKTPRSSLLPRVLKKKFASTALLLLP
jgi:hypothetical protein